MNGGQAANMQPQRAPQPNQAPQQPANVPAMPSSSMPPSSLPPQGQPYQGQPPVGYEPPMPEPSRLCCKSGIRLHHAPQGSAPGQQQVPNQQQAPGQTQAQPASGSAASGLLAARNQLRSKAKRDGSAPDSGKKGEPVRAKKVATTSVLDRIANKQNGQVKAAGNAMPVPGIPTAAAQADNAGQASDKTAEYQWRPTMQPEPSEETPQVVAPKLLKQALEHEKTPEMVKLLVKEAANQDSWSDWVTKLNVGRMVQQLALNSAFEREGNQVKLCLRPSQQHLNTPKAQEQLAVAISELFAEAVSLELN